MTESRHSRADALVATAVVALALAAFLIVFTVLARQMRTGNDPAIQPAVAQQPRVIVKRRIVEKRIVVVDAPRAAASAPLPASSASSQQGRAVAVRAPVQAAPVAPAPAPAPAPVTRSS
jgi:hypothetical protein